MTGGDSADALETTFSLAANEIRLDVLRTLWDSYTEDPTPEPEPVQFSTLKERVGIRDSGQFHYHLDELVPQFVSHHDEGYTLTYAGAKIVGAGFSGVSTDTDATLDVRAVGECWNAMGRSDCDTSRATLSSTVTVVRRRASCPRRRSSPSHTTSRRTRNCSGRSR